MFFIQIYSEKGHLWKIWKTWEITIYCDYNIVCLCNNIYWLAKRYCNCSQTVMKKTYITAWRYMKTTDIAQWKSHFGSLLYTVVLLDAGKIQKYIKVQSKWLNVCKICLNWSTELAFLNAVVIKPQWSLP